MQLYKQQFFFIISISSICYCSAWLTIPHRIIRPSTFSLRRTSPLFEVDGKNSIFDNILSPPIPFRDESAYVLAGELPSTKEDDTSPPPIRQSSSSTNQLLNPPQPIPNPYGWMRDESRSNDTVLNHLHAENEYGKQMTSHLETLREELYQEFLSSIHETDYTTPALKISSSGKGYWYYLRFEEGESYPRYYRAPQSNPNEIYPPPVNKDWDKKVTNSNNETYFPPLLPGEELYLDVPALARNETYFALGAIVQSPDNQYVAYSTDTKGGETCQIYVKHIESGEVWPLQNSTSLLECDGSIDWNEESNGLFYKIMDDTHRPYQLYYRQIFDSDGNWIGIDDQKEEDQLLLEENDELYNVRTGKTFDGKYLIVQCSSKESKEIHYLDLRPDNGDTSSNKLVCIAKRQHKVLYTVKHCHGYWLVQTNIGGLPNLSLKACKVGDEGMDKWKDVVSSSTGQIVFDGGNERTCDGLTVFSPTATDSDTSFPLAYAVITGREEGMPRVWFLELNEEREAEEDTSPLTVSQVTRLEFDEDAYDVGIGAIRDPTLPYCVIAYDSLVSPPSHIAIPLSNPVELDARRVLKEKEVPGYNKEQYACERTTVRSRDGKTDIPVSLVYHRNALKDRMNGPIPTHLYGYGSYGASIEASFRSTRLPLLNRGFVYALAHVRGGGENGRPWYDDARYLTKKNTFNDFVDIARWLVGEGTSADSTSSIGKGITTPQKLSCEGRSAGGLLVGASINQQPELFNAAIFGVPFVDVACTMIDSTIPLTVAEWEEWGNPNEEKYFEYIMGYSPMENVKTGAVYPSCLVTGGLHDPRVQYWEPAKFVAELRHNASEQSGPVILKMDMESGHFSASDRYKYLRELAFDYAFLLDTLCKS